MSKQQSLLKERKNFSRRVDAYFFSYGLVCCVLSVIGEISDPAVSLPFVSEISGRNLNFNI